MKSYKYLLGISAVALGVVMASCDDDMSSKLRSEARIEPYGFTVTSPNGNVYQAKYEGNNIYIKINPFIDPTTELVGAVPNFVLSMGATVEPTMSDPQDFSNLDEPVVYTVTSGDGKHKNKIYVSYTVTDKLPYGEGYTRGDLVVSRNFEQMGYPGKFGSLVTWETHVTATYGDLLAFPAFCGKDKLVMFSRRYAWGDDGTSDPKCKMSPNHKYAFMVYDAATLAQSGTLNIGDIDPMQVVAISSDAKGNMVAAVGRKAAGKTDFYYWTSPESAPVHMGTVGVSTDISNHDTDAAPYISVAGDVTEKAVIAAAAPRSDTGDHYKFKVSNGHVSSNYTVIHTGHSSNDESWFQMVAFFGPNDNDSYLVGDTEKNSDEEVSPIKVYLNSASGMNIATMDYHTPGINGWTPDYGDTWWSRGGQMLKRGGGRRPSVSAMVLNGKPYSYFTTGGEYTNRGCMMTQSFTETILQYPHFGWGLTTIGINSKEPNSGSGWVPWSFGMMQDWMWDDEEQEGYVAVWSERFGVHMFRLTCYE